MADDPTPVDPATPPVSDPAPAAPPPADPAPAADPTPAPPADPATPADPAPAAPVVPERYELALPENSLLRDDDVRFAAAEAKALGLTNDQAQTMLNARAAAVQVQADAFLADAKADPQIGGAKWAETETHAKAGIEWALKDASPEEQQLVTDTLNRTGLGNHKAWIRMMARIGRARAEDPTTGTSRTPAASRPQSAADRMYGEPAKV